MILLPKWTKWGGVPLKNTNFIFSESPYWAIPWWRLWPKFENFSLLIDHSSYIKQAYQSFRGWCTKYLGWSIHSNPKKINLGQGQAQCPCNARLRLWLRTKVGSASESLQSPISVKCDRVLCQHLYLMDDILLNTLPFSTWKSILPL